jgi:hypothetical protein
MRQLYIQVQADSSDKSILRLISVLMRLPAAKDLRIHKGPVRQEYTNLFVPTPNVRKLWDSLSDVFRRDKALRERSIVVCEGKHGWDDYELIYHMDPDQIDPKWR